MAVLCWFARREAPQAGACGVSDITCGKCGICFSVPDHWLETRKRNHAYFWCPNGHERYFPGESDIEKAQREVREAQALANDHAHGRLVAEKELERVKAEANRIRKRVAAGVCPCCNRTFANLAGHMRVKHKGYALPAAAAKQITGTIQ